MSVLRSLESKIAGLVEGTFSRAFRSEVRPVEIARKLTREMEEHKSYSVSRTYVPNEYRVYLSPRDRARFADYEDALATELAGYLLEYARREKLALLSRRHAEIRPRGGSWVLTDLGSTNGSCLNGRRIEDPEVLKPGDEIELGTSTLTFELE